MKLYTDKNEGGPGLFVAEEADDFEVLAHPAVAALVAERDRLVGHAERMAAGLTQDCDGAADYGRNPSACNSCRIGICPASSYRRDYPAQAPGKD